MDSEYDLEIRTTKIVKGQGLAKLMAQSNCEVLGVNFFDVCSKNATQVEERKVHLGFTTSSWYKDIIYFLQNLQTPPNLSKTKVISISLKTGKFCIINIYLFWKDPGVVLLNCLLEKKSQKENKRDL